MEYPINIKYQLGSYYEDNNVIVFIWNGNMGHGMSVVYQLMEHFGYNYDDLKSKYNFVEEGWPDYYYEIEFYKG